MYCKKCGQQLGDNQRYCPNCGTPQNTGNEWSGAADRCYSGGYNANPGTPGSGYTEGPLATDRSLVMYILLTVVTCGIYGFYFLYCLARDVNVACNGDGETTPGLAQLIIFSLLTCGIYSYYWYYKLGNRLAANAPRYGMSFEENGTTVIIWCLLGYVICGIGSWIAMHILIKNTNAICGAYNNYVSRR